MHGCAAVDTPLRPAEEASTTGWLRSARVQAVLLGLVFFCVPGMWNSITSMAGGLTDPTAASATTAALYGTFGVTSMLSPLATNVIGPRATLFVGALCYIFYIFALLLYSKGAASAAVVIMCGVVNGVGAGLVWTAQGMLMLSYPTSQTKGSFVATFWLVFQSGAVLGGFLSLGLNFHDQAPDVSAGTYIAYMVVMLVGAAVVLLLQPLDRVVRPDGSRVPPTPPVPVYAELRAMGAMCVDGRILPLLPYFVYSNWFYAYQFDCYNKQLFDARTQGFNNALYWAAGMGGAFAIGHYLDHSRRPLRARAAASLVAIAVLSLGAWGAGVYVNYAHDLDHAAPHGDFISDTGAWAGPAALFVAWGGIDSMAQCWIYWLMGQLDESPLVLSRFVGVYKGVQSFGGAAAWALSATYSPGSVGGVPPSVQVWLNVALFLVALPPAALAVSRASALGSRASDGALVVNTERT